MDGLDFRELDSTRCSIARAVSLLGDRWTLVVLRDLGNGVRRFDELCTHLGIARDVLTARLTRLVDAGLVERREYREQGSRARHEYVLTSIGHDLRTVLVALMDFGDAHLSGSHGPPMSLRHRDCGAPIHARLVCDDGHQIGGDAPVDLLVVEGEHRVAVPER